MTPPKYDVFVIGGLGHIGLPFGLAMADAGLQVALYDLDESKRTLVRQGKLPFFEQGAQRVLARVIGKTLHLSSRLKDSGAAGIVVITIGTPLDEHLNPKLLPVLELCEELTPYLSPGTHLMLRSTVYPGTSQRILDFFERRGLPLHLSFCPERIVQGKALQELGKLRQIISGSSRRACTKARSLFKTLKSLTIELTLQEAELAKLFSNSWRYIQFATANQFYMIAAENGADFSRIRHAMTAGYSRAKDLPLPGFAAGPCLLKDTLQLSAFHRSGFSLGRTAVLINEGLPGFLVDLLRNMAGVELSGAKVGILGMAFKADIDDTRDSLSYKLGKILRFYGARVFYSDEFVKDPTFVSKEKLIASCSIVFVGVPHSAYKGLLIPNGVRVVDPWNVIRRPLPETPSGMVRRTLRLAGRERARVE